MRKARLLAELAGKDQIDVPPELQKLPQSADLLASEDALMKSRSQRLKTQLQALAEPESLAAKRGRSAGEEDRYAKPAA